MASGGRGTTDVRRDAGCPIVRRGLPFLCVVMQRCEKHYVMHRISVDDFDLWKNVFDDLRSKLKGAGSKADFVF